MPTTMANTLPIRTQAICSMARVVEGRIGCGGLLNSLAAYRISNMPKMLGRMVKGVQQMPTIVTMAIADAASPQKILMMPLARVIQAMTFTKVGFSG